MSRSRMLWWLGTSKVSQKRVILASWFTYSRRFIATEFWLSKTPSWNILLITRALHASRRAETLTSDWRLYFFKCRSRFEFLLVCLWTIESFSTLYFLLDHWWLLFRRKSWWRWIERRVFSWSKFKGCNLFLTKNSFIFAGELVDWLC